MSNRNRRQPAPPDDPQRDAQPARRRTRLRKQKPLRRQRGLLEAATAALQPRLAQRSRPTTAAPQAAPLPPSAQRRRVRNNLLPVRNFTFNVRAMIMSPRWYSAVLLGLCVYALVLIGTNRRFYLDAIDVQGVRVLPAAEVIGASGAFGAHVFAINPDDVAQQIGALPGVRSVQVELRWPDALTIVVEEDAPLLKWQENGQLLWVNADGALIPAAQRDLDLLLIEADLPPAPADNCRDAAADAAADAEAAADVAPARPATYLCFVPPAVIDAALALRVARPELTTLTYSQIGGLRFQEAGGWTVYVGTGDDDDVRAKLAVYDALLASLQARGITPEYINVSYLDKPVYKPLGGLQ